MQDHTGQYETIQNHTKPHRTIQGHIRLYRTIKENAGPDKTIQHHTRAQVETSRLQNQIESGLIFVHLK